jgi:trehalose-6-phosphatase
MIHCIVQAMEVSEKFGEASSRGKSPERVPMEVSDDEQDEALLKLNEDEFRELQKVDSIQVIEGMRISPKDASRYDIPLCRMVYMPLVHPTCRNTG